MGTRPVTISRTTPATSTSPSAHIPQVWLRSVRPNKYEAGRANIAIFNWDGKAAVNVDISSVLTPGASYVVQDVQNYFGSPVTSGVYSGGTISIPMNSTTIVAPVGTGYKTYFHTTRVFGSFILTLRDVVTPPASLPLR